MQPALSFRITPVSSSFHGNRLLGLTTELKDLNSMGRKELATIWWENCVRNCQAHRIARKRTCRQYCRPLRCNIAFISRHVIQLNSNISIHPQCSTPELVQLEELEQGVYDLAVGNEGEDPWMRFEIEVVEVYVQLAQDTQLSFPSQDSCSTPVSKLPADKSLKRQRSRSDSVESTHTQLSPRRNLFSDETIKRCATKPSEDVSDMLSGNVTIAKQSPFRRQTRFSDSKTNVDSSKDSMFRLGQDSISSEDNDNDLVQPSSQNVARESICVTPYTSRPLESQSTKDVRRLSPRQLWDTADSQQSVLSVPLPTQGEETAPSQTQAQPLPRKRLCSTLSMEEWKSLRRRSGTSLRGSIIDLILANNKGRVHPTWLPPLLHPDCQVIQDVT